MKRLRIATAFLMFFMFACGVNAAGVVSAGTSQLADSGSAVLPAQWFLAGDYEAPVGTFTIGGAGKSFNQLSVTTNQTLTTTGDLVVGPTNSRNNLLNINSGGYVQVNGAFRSGQGSISYYSQYNRTHVSGLGSVLAVTDSLYVGNGTTWTSTENALSISDGGIVIVDSDKDGLGGLSLLNHWSYGNSWLELGEEGQLFWYGDKTNAFSNEMLSSIKVWDYETDTLQRVAYYNSTTWNATEYLDLLQIAYVQDSAMAAELGVDDDYVGFTVVQAVPEPATISLIGLGVMMLRRKKS